MMDDFADLFADFAVDEQDLSLDWSMLFDADDTNLWYSLETTVQDLITLSNDEEPPTADVSNDQSHVPTEESTVYNKIPEYFQAPVTDENKHCRQVEHLPTQSTNSRVSATTRSCEIKSSSFEECETLDSGLYTKIPSYITGLTGLNKQYASKKASAQKTSSQIPNINTQCDMKTQTIANANANDNKLVNSSITRLTDHNDDLTNKQTASSGKRGRQATAFQQHKYPRQGFQTWDRQVPRSFSPSFTNQRRIKGVPFEKMKPPEDRRIVYVGNVAEDTTTATLRQHFAVFGVIEDVSLHFREHGENYGFVTFAKTADAIRAIEHGNDDPNHPKYDLCFGGRRNFCKSRYADLDSLDSSTNQRTANETDFDTLLKSARMTSER